MSAGDTIDKVVRKFTICDQVSAMYITSKTLLHSTLAHRIRVLCVLLHDVPAYLNMRTPDGTYNGAYYHVLCYIPFS